jgi:opacity protein-like surface antigen
MAMRLLLAASAATVLAAPAAARDGRAYVGIEGGLLIPRPQTSDAQVVYTTTDISGIPAPGPAGFTFEDAYDQHYRRGIDVDALAGFDFGAFRLEGELGWKRARLKETEIDPGFLARLNADLNRPSVEGFPGLDALPAGDFDFSDRVNIISAMANALVDIGPRDGVSVYGGAGFGRAWARFHGDRDTAWAWQLIAGARYPVRPNIEIGLKYRYFRTRQLDFADDRAFAAEGNGRRFVDRFGVTVRGDSRTTNAAVFNSSTTRFRSHSLLASLTFNFGATAAPLQLPPPPPKPPAPPLPATRACPGGSVVLATDPCPAPLPPPAAEPERG